MLQAACPLRKIPAAPSLAPPNHVLTNEIHTARNGSQLFEAPLILLDYALPAGTFQIPAELGGFFGGSERTGHGAVTDPLVAEIGALDDRRTGPQRGPKLVLQPAVGGLRVGLVLLRGDLNQKPAAG